MNYDNAFFDKVIDRENTNCVKWDKRAVREGVQMLPMWVADMDFRCPEEVTRALVERASHPIYGYTDQSEAAVQAALDFMSRRHGIELTAEHHTLLPCVITGLRAAVLALTEPGDHVIVQPPVYGPFYASVKDNGRSLALSPLISDGEGRYSMNLAEVERLCREGARLMLLCNPHNPVSRAWSREELAALMEILARYGVTLISDEIHGDFVYKQGGFTSVLTVSSDADARVAALTSVSKTFNLAGLQQAVLFTRNADIRSKMSAVMQNAGVTCGNIFALTATEAAYRFGDAWLDALLNYLKQADALMRRELAARLPEVVVSPLEATYLAWLDMRAYGMTTDELMRRAYLAGVELTPGTFFGRAEGEGFLRMNLACPHASTLEAVKRLEKAVKEIK